MATAACRWCQNAGFPVSSLAAPGTPGNPCSAVISAAVITSKRMRTRLLPHEPPDSRVARNAAPRLAPPTGISAAARAAGEITWQPPELTASSVMMSSTAWRAAQEHLQAA
jgi:hypothetical protein